jgi:hypothetical protein
MDQPRNEFSSIVEVFERALAQEQEVSRQIDALYELAFTQKVFAAMAELQWFITEQVEEEKTVREIVAKFHMVATDSLQGIAHDIQQRLHDLAAIDADRRQTRIVVAHDLHALGRLCGDQLGYVLGQLMRIDDLLAAQAAGPEDAVDQGGEAVGLGDDDLGVALQVAAWQPPLE